MTGAIAQSPEIAGFAFSGTRFDCGSKAGMLAATLHLAAQDPELVPVLDSIQTGRTAPAQAA